MIKNFELKSSSNLNRIANEYVIHMRSKLLGPDVLEQLKTQFDRLQSGLKCSMLEKQDALLKDFPINIFDYGQVKFEVKDMDYLTNMDAS